MIRKHNFFIILILGLLISASSFSNEVNQNDYETSPEQIELIYEKIITDPNLPEDEKDFLNNSQRAWKIYYEESIKSYITSSYSETNKGAELEADVLAFKNSRLKKRLNVLNDIYAKLRSQ